MSHPLVNLSREEKKHIQEQRAGRVWRKRTKTTLTEQEKADELREYVASTN